MDFTIKVQCGEIQEVSELLKLLQKVLEDYRIPEPVRDTYRYQARPWFEKLGGDYHV